MLEHVASDRGHHLGEVVDHVGDAQKGHSPDKVRTPPRLEPPVEPKKRTVLLMYQDVVVARQDIGNGNHIPSGRLSSMRARWSNLTLRLLMNSFKLRLASMIVRFFLPGGCDTWSGRHSQGSSSTSMMAPISSKSVISSSRNGRCSGLRANWLCGKRLLGGYSDNGIL